jgi:hypothetical protein
MSPARVNEKRIVNNIVDKAVFIGYSAGIEAGQVMLQGFGLPNAVKWVAFNVAYEIHNLFGDFFCQLMPTGRNHPGLLYWRIRFSFDHFLKLFHGHANAFAAFLCFH